MTDTAPTQMFTSIEVKFQQGELNLCMIKSLASALYYMGLKCEAGELITKSTNFEFLALDHAQY